MKNTLAELGDEAIHRISGFKGTVVCLSYWLGGCNRVTLQPKGLDKDSKLQGMETFDASQIEVTKKNSVPAAKPRGGPMPAPRRQADARR